MQPALHLRRFAGKWVIPANETHNKESSDLMATLSVHSLTVLNSWNRPSHKQLVTFTFGQLASQIDFLMCRQEQATHCAKQAATLQQFRGSCVEGWSQTLSSVRSGHGPGPALAQG